MAAQAYLRKNNNIIRYINKKCNICYSDCNKYKKYIDNKIRRIHRHHHCHKTLKKSKQIWSYNKGRLNLKLSSLRKLNNSCRRRRLQKQNKCFATILRNNIIRKFFNKEQTHKYHSTNIQHSSTAAAAPATSIPKLEKTFDKKRAVFRQQPSLYHCKKGKILIRITQAIVINKT